MGYPKKACLQWILPAADVKWVDYAMAHKWIVGPKARNFMGCPTAYELRWVCQSVRKSSIPRPSWCSWIGVYGAFGFDHAQCYLKQYTSILATGGTIKALLTWVEKKLGGVCGWLCLLDMNWLIWNGKRKISRLWPLGFIAILKQKKSYF